MPGSPTTPGRPGTRARAPVRVAFRDLNRVGTRNKTSFAAQWLACALPCRRFAVTLAGANARLGAEVVSLRLPRGGLAPPTPCRSPGALGLSSSYYTSALCRLPQARPHRQAGQCRHCRDRPRAGRLYLGHRPARTAGGGLIEANASAYPREAPANYPTRYCRARLGARPRSGEPSQPPSAGSSIRRRVPRPRPLRDASTVMRFRSAHQSMINPRYDGRASCPARQSLKQSLETKPPIHATATWKGGLNQTDGSQLLFFRHPAEAGGPGPQTQCRPALGARFHGHVLSVKI